MIRQPQETERPPEPQAGQPAESGEGWLGQNRSGKRRLWERLNPRHRKELRILAEALALQQNHARLPEAARGRLDSALADLDRVTRRIAALLAEVGTPDTAARVSLAAVHQQAHTHPMNTARCPRAILGLAALLAATASATTARADEIRLKDGKKLHGVIVAYEDNMFKVKTDFGYVLVEKDKIAAIIPDTPADSPEAKAAAKPAAQAAPAANRDSVGGSATPAVETPSKPAKTVILNNASARPSIPLTAAKGDAAPPPIKTVNATPKATLAAATPPPPPPKVEPPPIKEEVQGNLYINHEYAFRMYKAPSWEIIPEAGQTLPNAIVAMGTNNESTLLVVGYEKSRTALDPAAQAVEKKLSEVYDNYRLISQRTTAVGGQPAVEYHYRGMADGHDWSGTLAVVGRNGEIFTVLGMTYADNDLIQIQENVITRAIASLDFNQK